MSHVRQRMRKAAAASLKAGNTDALHDIYDSLIFPSDESNLPLIYVHFDEEDSDRASTGGLLQREATLIATAVAQAGEESLDDVLDTLAFQIEAIIGNDDLGGLSKATELVRTEFERSSGGSRASGEVSLSFRVTYHTSTSNGETAL